MRDPFLIKQKEQLIIYTEIRFRFSQLQADRTLSHGGGIALFYKTKLKAVLLFHQITVHAEMMGVLLKIKLKFYSYWLQAAKWIVHSVH